MSGEWTGPDERMADAMHEAATDHLPHPMTSAAGRGYLSSVPSVGAGYVRRTGTTSPTVTEDERVVCRHCQADLPALGDHTCPCPFSDEECPDHG